jgi:hypothetical protein
MVFESPDFRWIGAVFSRKAAFRGDFAMSTFHKYPEIVRLDKRPEILSVKQVVATEKVHGTNFRVFFPAGMTSLAEVRFGGRNEEFAAGEDGFYGGRPARWFKDRPELLQRLFEVFASHGFAEVTLFGEAFGAGIQRGVRYVPGDQIHFRAFDIMVGDNFVTCKFPANIVSDRPCRAVFRPKRRVKARSNELRAFWGPRGRGSRK